MKANSFKYLDSTVSMFLKIVVIKYNIFMICTNANSPSSFVS